jgi:hypothetical protein
VERRGKFSEGGRQNRELNDLARVSSQTDGFGDGFGGKRGEMGGARRVGDVGRVGVAVHKSCFIS